MNALQTIQTGFQDYVLGHALNPADAQPAIVAAVREQFGLKAHERLAIYYNAYRIRLREALCEAYDKTWSYLGDDMFAELADSYVAAHPSHYRNLRWFGAGLADHAALRYADHPYIAELARFEWTLGLAFDAADAVPVCAAELSALAPEDWGGLMFGLHPSVQLLSMEWNAVALWQALGGEREPPQAQRAAAPAHWLVWRSGEQPHFRSLSEREALALGRIGQGMSFGALCDSAAADAAGDADGADGAAVTALAGYLQHWLAQGLLTR